MKAQDGRVAVIGSGAVGCYYGAKLSRAGRAVTFLMRRDFAHVREHGLQVISPEGDFQVNVCCASSTESMGHCDLVLIALKSTDNEALPELLRPLIKEESLLLTLQNGLGNEEFLAKHFGAERVLGGLCFVCLNRVGPGQIKHFSAGAITIGEFARPCLPRTEELAAEFRRCGIECHAAVDLMEARWRKLVWNIPFNGLSIAVGGIDVARILAEPSLLVLTRQLMEEVIEAANRLGLPIPPDYLEEQLAKTRDMGPYKPSSLLDYLAGKPVEVEAIWGEPLRRARSAEASTPRLEMLYQLLQAKLSCRPSEDGQKIRA